MTKPKVVVGFAEADSAPEVVWSLIDAGFDVMAFARSGRASALRHSRHVRCHDIVPPERDAQASIADIHSLVRSMTRNAGDGTCVLFPLDDTALWLCSMVPSEPACILAGAQGASAEFALNKHLQTQLARQAGFNVPTSALVRTIDELRAFREAEGFPIIVKPAHCVPIVNGRRHVSRKWICADSHEFERCIAEWAEQIPLLAQAFVTGNGEGVFGIAAPDGIRAWSAHRRLRMMNPQGSGSSACVSEVVPDGLKTIAARLVAMSQWHGLFMIELLRDPSGKIWFVEFNGRPWGSMALSRRQGLEYPAWHVMLAVDPQSKAGLVSGSTAGVVCRHVGRELMHLLFVLRGPKSKALKRWPSFWEAITGVLRVGHGDGFYNWRRSDPGVFIADCYHTLHSNLIKSKN